ncbi:MAG: IS1595 family transposase [Fimbriimonadaceae bacterium]|nr:IS1595 family transposase [Fimbriimonadaceae bacterium]
MSNLQNHIFNDHEAARKALEAVRWPNGPICPHCGNADPDRIALIKGKKEEERRPGLYYCNECKGQFTVTVGTVFERSKIPLTKWWLAVHLLGSSKKGMSAHQLHRMLGVTYKTAWFMAHRIREAMKDMAPTPLGGEGKIVEADATYVGGKEKNKPLGKRKGRNIGGMGKQVVHTLVERGGRARSEHVANVSGKTLRSSIVKNVRRESTLMTDTHGGYAEVGKEFARHEMVNHEADEYVRGDAHNNTAEGFFSIFKRGVVGTYHSISEAHLHRYLAEFDFRYNNRTALGVNDKERTRRMMEGIEGKRLTYRRIGEA